MKYVIYAVEGMYQGLHGIEYCAMHDLQGTEEEIIDQINDIGSYESYELIYTYGLEDEYLLDAYSGEEIEDIKDSPYYEPQWNAWRIKDEYQSMPEDDLEELFAEHSLVFFTEKYCEKEPIV